MAINKNMLSRIGSGTLFFVFFFLGLFQEQWFGWVLPVLLAFGALAGVREALSFGASPTPRFHAALAMVGALAMLGDAYWFHLDHILMIIGLMTVLALAAGVWIPEGNLMAMAGKCVTATVYVAFPLALLTFIWRQALETLPMIAGNDTLRATSAQHYLIFLIFATWSSDIGAYFAGRLWGKHKLAPKLSPGKTIEGFIGGVVFTLLVMVVMHLCWNNISSLFRLWEVLALGLLFSIIGPIGDLAESRMKRGAGIKDSGHTFTGHGGMLDIIDSLLFTTPVYYAYLYLFHRVIF